MDTLKLDPCAHLPNGLEKGCSEHEGHSETCPACSGQPPQLRRRRSCVRHPWVIVGVIALTWLVFSCGKRAISHPYPGVWNLDSEVVGHSDAHHPPPPPPPPSTDANIGQCVDNARWTQYDQPPWASDYPYGAEATFSLPVDSDILSLVSKGGFQQGQVTIEQSAQVADTVDVHVQVAYHIKEIFKQTTVCQTERADRDHGVGIFTFSKFPRIRGPSAQLKFDITVTLPAGAEGPLKIKKLETMLPNYSQNVVDLKSVIFDSISLWSANGKLSVESITSEFGQFASMNGEINGYFNVLSALDLRTMNGRIAPTVKVLNREGADPSRLSIHTMNGQIDTKVSLTSDASTGGEFQVEADSKSGQVGLKFVETPVDSVLRCRAQTVFGSIEVKLDSAFEGTYSLQSVLGSKSVLQQQVEDPAGKGRQRLISQSSGVGLVEGKVNWVDSDGGSSENEGYVALKTTVSSINLFV